MVPPKLKQALELFKSLPKELRSQVLLEYAAKVPPPPPGVELERLVQVTALDGLGGTLASSRLVPGNRAPSPR